MARPLRSARRLDTPQRLPDRAEISCHGTWTAFTRVLRVMGRPVSIATLGLLLLGLAGCFTAANSGRSGVESDRSEAVSGILYTRNPSLGRTVVGVASAPRAAGRRRSELTLPSKPYGDTVAWLGNGRIVATKVGATRRSDAVILRYQGGKLKREGRSIPLPGAWSIAPSPDGNLIAVQPARPCAPRGRCFAPSKRILLVRVSNGDRRRVAHGDLAGWSPQGELVYWPEVKPSHSRLDALDVSSGEHRVLVSSRRLMPDKAGARPAEIGSPAWSADGRYLAFLLFDRFPAPIVVTKTGSERILRRVRSPEVIWTITWSPTEHRLAYTSGGRLFVLDKPGGTTRRLYEFKRHFEWATWSPDGTSILLGDRSSAPFSKGRAHPPGRWPAVRVANGHPIGFLPRLGGTPEWCCPEGSAAFTGYG